MGSLDDPKTWVPYMNNQDCSKRICNLYCPQWCNYVVLPSPPPPIAFSDDDSGGVATLSPLVIVIIGVLGSAFLLISYYVIISRLCVGSNDASESSTRRGIAIRETLDLEMDEDEFDMEDDRLNYAPWHVPSKGLEKDLIDSIRVCKYKKEDGLVSCTDCSVCLGEFQEDENLRVLPKCSHAFHVHCIDTWLTNHSNCPLCRAHVSCVNAPALFLPPPPPPIFEDHESSSDNDMSVVLPPPPPPPFSPANQESARNGEENVSRRVTSEIGGGGDAIIEIREEESRREIRRSVSTSYLGQARVSVADILLVNREEEMKPEECIFKDETRQSWGQVLDENNRHLNCVGVSSNVMKRSFSSGRYLFTRGWRTSNN